MQQNAVNNPFRVENFDYSWEAIRDLVDEVAKRFPNKYKLAYFNDYQQKLILLINPDHSIFTISEAMLVSISKIDACKSSCLLAFEAKKYQGEIVTSYDFERAESSIKLFYEDMFMVNRLN